MEEGDPPVLVRDMVRILEERPPGELTESATLRKGEARFEARRRALVRVMKTARATVALA